MTAIEKSNVESAIKAGLDKNCLPVTLGVYNSFPSQHFTLSAWVGKNFGSFCAIDWQKAGQKFSFAWQVDPNTDRSILKDLAPEIESLLP